MTTGSLIDPARPGDGSPVSLGAGLMLRPLVDADIGPLAIAMAAMEPWKALGYGADVLNRYWLRPDPGAARIAIDAEGRCQGALCVRPRWLRGAFLELLCLLREAQGRGYGRLLLAWLARDAALLGSNLWTSVDADNARANVLYRNAGFVEAARLTALLAPEREEILLRLPLDGRTAPATAVNPAARR